MTRPVLALAIALAGCADAPVTPRPIASGAWSSVALSGDGERLHTEGGDEWLVGDEGVRPAKRPRGAPKIASGAIPDVVAEVVHVGEATWVRGERGDLYRFDRGGRTWVTGAVDWFVVAPDGERVAVDRQGVLGPDGRELRDAPPWELIGWTEPGFVSCDAGACVLLDERTGTKTPLPPGVVAAAGRTLVTKVEGGYAVWRL